MVRLSLFRRGETLPVALKKPPSTVSRGSRRTAHSPSPSEDSSADEHSVPESEVQWLRKMIEKEKAEKEWIMARYEVAEFYLKAKDEEIQRLRGELSKGAAPTSPVFCIPAKVGKVEEPFIAPQAPFIAPQVEKAKPKAEPRAPMSLKDRRGVQLSLVGSVVSNAGPRSAVQLVTSESLPGQPIAGFAQSQPQQQQQEHQQMRQVSSLNMRRKSLPCGSSELLTVDTKQKLDEDMGPQSPKRRVPSKTWSNHNPANANAPKDGEAGDAFGRSVTERMGTALLVRPSGLQRRRSEPSAAVLTVNTTKTNRLDEEPASPKRVTGRPLSGAKWSRMSSLTSGSSAPAGGDEPSGEQGGAQKRVAGEVAKTENA